MTLAVRNVPRVPGIEIRCPTPSCNKKLAEVIVPGGRVQIWCPRCRHIVQFETFEEASNGTPVVRR